MSSIRKPKTSLPMIQAASHRITDSLRKCEKEADIDTSPLNPAEKKAASPLLRMPDEAITTAIDIAERHPARFSDYDVSAARYALAYEHAMAPVAEQLRILAARIEESIFKRRVGTIRQTLALYGAMKSLSRFGGVESMLTQMTQLKMLVRSHAPKRKPKAPAATAATPAASPEPSAPASPTPSAATTNGATPPPATALS